MRSVELRSITSELRAAGPMKLAGYASVYDSPYDCGSFTEFIRKGAFDGVMGSDVRCLFNHHHDNLLGRTTSGTLSISQDDRGLKYECDLPDTPLARDLHKMVARGDVTGSSFSFSVGDQRWSSDGSEREILSVEQLYDVGPVTYPAYEETSVHARNLQKRFATRIACRFGCCKAPAPTLNLELERARLMINIARLR